MRSHTFFVSTTSLAKPTHEPSLCAPNLVMNVAQSISETSFTIFRVLRYIVQLTVVCDFTISCTAHLTCHKKSQKPNHLPNLV